MSNKLNIDGERSDVFLGDMNRTQWVPPPAPPPVPPPPEVEVDIIYVRLYEDGGYRMTEGSLVMGPEYLDIPGADVSTHTNRVTNTGAVRVTNTGATRVIND